jgi:hypothetical protein
MTATVSLREMIKEFEESDIPFEVAKLNSQAFIVIPATGEIFVEDPEDGMIKAGKDVSYGHYRVTIGGKRYFQHDIIYMVTHGIQYRGAIVHHIDCCKTNNKYWNLLGTNKSVHKRLHWLYDRYPEYRGFIEHHLLWVRHKYFDTPELEILENALKKQIEEDKKK